MGCADLDDLVSSLAWHVDNTLVKSDYTLLSGNHVETGEGNLL